MELGTQPPTEKVERTRRARTARALLADYSDAIRALQPPAGAVTNLSDAEFAEPTSLDQLALESLATKRNSLNCLFRVDWSFSEPSKVDSRSILPHRKVRSEGGKMSPILPRTALATAGIAG